MSGNTKDSSRSSWRLSSPTTFGLTSTDATATAVNHVATPDSTLTSIVIDSLVANGMGRETAIVLQNLSASLHAAEFSKEDKDRDEGFESKKRKTRKSSSQEQEDGGVAEMVIGPRDASSFKSSGNGKGFRCKLGNDAKGANRGGGGECGVSRKRVGAYRSKPQRPWTVTDESHAAQLMSLKSDVSELKSMFETLAKHLMKSDGKGFGN